MYGMQEMVKEDLHQMTYLLSHYAVGKAAALKTLPLLELGARSGWGTQLMRQEGWIKAQGLELSDDAVAYAKSHNRCLHPIPRMLIDLVFQ